MEEEMEGERISDTSEIEYSEEAFEEQDTQQLLTITFVEGGVDMVFYDAVDEDPVVGDPFNLKEAQLYEEILKYLDVKDILSLTEVSKFWNSFVGEGSDNTMDRLKIVVDETDQRRFTDVLETSKRRYRHLEIRALFDSINEMTQFICNNSRSLVSIRTAYDIPSIALPHVTELFFFGKDLDKSKIAFFDNGLIVAAVNLETLIIWVQVKNPDFVRIIINCSYLKKLVLEFGAAACFLPVFDRCTNFGFKLETFYCDAAINQYDHCSSFLRMIKMHQNSLKSIKFKGTYDLLKEVLYELPKLETLTFYPNVNAANNTNFLRTAPHSKLKEANLICTNYSFIQNFIEIAPNLQTLYVSHLNCEILKMVAAKAVKLQCFKFACPIDATLKGLNEFYRLISINMNNNRSKMKLVQI